MSRYRRQTFNTSGTTTTHAASARVLLVGLGNIGSHAADVLSRHVSFLRIVDRDTVETHNSLNQSYASTDLGRAKVDVVAERLRQLVPEVEVEPHRSDIEDLAWEDFADVDIVLAGLDSLRARQIISEKVGPLEIPYVDGAVGEPQCVRVQVLLPGQACLECQWGDAQYRQLAIEYPCGTSSGNQAPRTIAPNCTGAAAAALMVAQYLALVNGHVPQDSYEINGDLVMGRFLRCRKRRNEQCRAPHAVAPRVLSCDKPFTQMTIAGVLAQIPQEFLSVGVQLSFPRGVLKNELFDDQRIATPEQLRPQQQLRLNELGLRSRDRIVARANGQTAHICFDGTGTNER